MILLFRFLLLPCAFPGQVSMDGKRSLSPGAPPPAGDARAVSPHGGRGARACAAPVPDRDGAGAARASAPARGVRVTRKRSGGACGCCGALHADSSPRRAPLPPCPAAPAPASTGTSPSSRPRAASTKSVRSGPAGPPLNCPVTGPACPRPRPRRSPPSGAAAGPRKLRRVPQPVRRGRRGASRGSGAPAPSWPGPAVCRESSVGAWSSGGPGRAGVGARGRDPGMR